ncbi:LacI family DNA-binding transcriptional regulator [Sphingomonas solaris]|uniref:LacI family DNA-binding transcriptional regulator n=1 Tax=Alterirhizorhabdus solaris TaxID=2529389 RepID=UPI001EEF7AA1|nr:LacI family DNA-binding transcriptional regulator [Sphingomonas solaris]
MGTIGIRDVAKAAGVSPATVSRTLAGRAVDPAMRAAVEAAVRETGYRPNLAARRLRSRDTGTIGLIVADIRNPFFTAIARAVEEAAYARGLRVILCNTDEDPARETLYLRLMEEERVTGVILAPTRETPAVRAADLAVPVVLIDRSPPGGDHDAVLLDNRAASTMLVDHLHAQGYTRIAGLFGATSMTGHERRAGYLAATARLGLAADARAVPHGPGETEAVVAALLARADPPDALIASNGVMLLSVIRALNAAGAGQAGPAIAGFDNEPWTEVVCGGVTLIEQPVEQIGGEAMAMLLDRLHQPDASRRTVMLGGRLIVRGSTARRE